MVEPSYLTCGFYSIDMPGAWDDVKIIRIDEVCGVGGCSQAIWYVPGQV